MIYKAKSTESALSSVRGDGVCSYFSLNKNREIICTKTIYPINRVESI